jgi:hypothetical protein
VRFADSDEYDERGIFSELAAKHNVVYSLEDERGLRGSFDECIEQMLKEGNHPGLHARLISHQVSTGDPPPPVGASSRGAEGEEEETLGEGGDVDEWSAAGGSYAEAQQLVGRCLEVLWDTPVGPVWQTGVAKGISRKRGLLIKYEDGEAKYHLNISNEVEDEVWRFV